VKISVITVCFNAVKTIEDTIVSVAEQKFHDIEHMVVDGASTDGTQEIVRKYSGTIAKWVSEPDNGIYDAMNKGVAMVTGDVVGFLNADDVYVDSGVLSKIAAVFEADDVHACYGDVVFVRDDLKTVVRYYRSNRFAPERLAYGWMPAHPTLFLKRDLLGLYGGFKTDYQIAADYELVARLFWKHGIKYKYIPEVLVKMRVGGVSTRGVKSNYILSKEIVRACRENSIRTNLLKVFLKYPLKFTELFRRPV